jgi:LysM repeat protein
MFSFQKLEKLKIKVYKAIERSGPAAVVFEVMFNPETYSITYNNKYGSQQGVNTSGTSRKYELTHPETMSFKLIFDATAASDFGLSKRVDVSKEVSRFLKETFYMDGDSHEPKYLKVEWGTLIFNCRLQSVTANYTLFDKSGKPLRAELSASFFSDIKDSERLRREHKSSPDLTHKRVVKAHDTLPLLCKEIYGSENYYIQVARANKLLSFRDLKPGQELFFPPIEK